MNGKERGKGGQKRKEREKEKKNTSQLVCAPNEMFWKNKQQELDLNWGRSHGRGGG
jgi:hypothetical protein